MTEDKPKLFSTETTLNNHRYFLTEDVGSADEYNEVVNVLLDATENDSFELIVNSNGGDYYGMLSFLAALEATECSTKAIIQGTAASCASMLALVCDAVEVHPQADMLVHHASYSLGLSKAHDQKKANEHILKQTEKTFRRVYAGFLTEEEILGCLRGDEMNMDSEEIILRLEQRDIWIENAGNCATIKS